METLCPEPGNTEEFGREQDKCAPEEFRKTWRSFLMLEHHFPAWCLRSAAGLDKCQGSPWHSHLGPVLIPPGWKCCAWDMDEGAVAQGVPGSIRDVGIAPGGVWGAG